MANLFDYFVKRRELEDQRLRSTMPTESGGIDLTVATDPRVAEVVRKSRVEPQPLPIRDINALLREKTSSVPGILQDGTETTQPVVDPNWKPPMQAQPTPLESAQGLLNQQLASDEPANQDSGWWAKLVDVLKQALISGGENWNNSRQQDPRLRLGEALGGMAGGATGQLLDPSLDEKRELAMDIGKQSQVVGNLQQQGEYDAKRAMEANKIEDTRIDNERLAMIREDRVAEAKQKSIDKAKETLRKSGWFDPKNKAHQQWARDAGLDPAELEGWDNRKHDTKKIAGVTYILKNGVFEPAEGIPADETEAVVNYEVTEGGRTQTFRVSNKDAAKFSAQAAALGMQIEAAKDRQLSSQTHDVRMAELRGIIEAKMIEKRAKVAEIAAEKAEIAKRKEKEEDSARLKELTKQLDQITQEGAKATAEYGNGQ